MTQTEEKKVRKNVLVDGTRIEKITFLDKRIQRDFPNVDKVELIGKIKEAIALPDDDSKFNALVKALKVASKKAPVMPLLNSLSEIYIEDAQTEQTELPLTATEETEDDEEEEDDE